MRAKRPSFPINFYILLLQMINKNASPTKNRKLINANLKVITIEVWRGDRKIKTRKG